MNTTALATSLLLLTTPVCAQRMIAMDSNRTLYDLDMTSGAKRQFGVVTANVGTAGGLANDITTGTVWLTSTSLDSLYTLDLATGNATLVGPYGDSTLVMHGIEYDFTTGTLYGGSRGNLYTIDTVTGAAALVGAGNPQTSFLNLCFDFLAGVMYATESGTDSFYRVDLATGALTLVGPLNGPTNPNGLAFDADTNTIWMVDNSQDRLYTIDRTTGAATEVGPLGSSNMLGLMYVAGRGNTRRVGTNCGPATIAAFGAPGIGQTVDASMTGATGIPFLGMGLAIGNAPVCATCSLGHDWSFLQFGADVALVVPNNPAFLGVQVGIQGADLGGIGGCAAPAVFTLTDTMVVTIG